MINPVKSFLTHGPQSVREIDNEDNSDIITCNNINNNIIVICSR